MCADSLAVLLASLGSGHTAARRSHGPRGARENSVPFLFPGKARKHVEAIFEVTHCEHLAKQLKRTNFAYRRHLNSTGTSQEGHVCSGVRDFSLAWGSLEDLARRASPCGAWATPSGLQASPVTWGTPVHLPGFSSHEAPVRLPLRHLLWSEECSQNSAPREVLPEQCFRNSAPMGLVPCELSTRESCPGSRVRTVLVQGASLSGMPVERGGAEVTQ